MSLNKKPSSTAEIREAFQKFFESKAHQRVSSSSIIPQNDPSLLFVNAGMVQFKDVFLGMDQRDYKRATTVQKCVRAGGKHNDLENVGFTARHHTFFEMLGNFSFGDYFKRQAIEYAWEFVTQVLKLPTEKIAVSVFETDDEAYNIWRDEIGVPEDRIFRFGEADNFWQMGETGPCGPCSEIFWDQGKEVDGERWLEFWNCVFMQYDRSADGTLNPLAAPSVDTGMGLERMAAIMQSVESNYDIDLMSGLIEKTKALLESLSGKKIEDKPGSKQESSLRVVVDHLRSTSFLIADGVLPSNEGRGYVLRRILRRAVRFGKQLGVEEPFLYKLYPHLKDAMADAYPELIERESVVCDILYQEEAKFYETLERGLSLLDEAFSKSKGKLLPADATFQLYDTFGFPLDLTELIAKERGYEVDHKGFEKLLAQQQDRSRASWKGSGAQAIPDGVKEWKGQGVKPVFSGYKNSSEKQAKILAIAANQDGSAWLSISPCPFYPESGGQVGDSGKLLADSKSYRVLDTQKPYEGGLAILVEDAGALKTGQQVEAMVDDERRSAIRSNHTATHLLHAALRKTLGTHVQQAGSVVDANRLRFDFSHNKAMSRDEIAAVEADVKQRVSQGIPLRLHEDVPIDKAKQLGAMALFGEKYGDRVRVVEIPEASIELCGGLHVEKTSDIGEVKLLSEAGVAAGTRRIELITGGAVAAWRASQVEKLKEQATKILESIKTQEVEKQSLMDKLGQAAPKELLWISYGELNSQLAKASQLNELQEFEGRLHHAQKTNAKAIEQLKGEIARDSSASVEKEINYKGVPLKFYLLEDADPKILRQKSDLLRQKESECAHLLWAPPNIMVTADTKKLDFHSGKFLKELVTQFGGKGGGQDRSAQGKLDGNKERFDEICTWISSGS